VFQNMDVEQLGSLNFANLVTCGHSLFFITKDINTPNYTLIIATNLIKLRQMNN